jgi:hypothetical protein
MTRPPGERIAVLETKLDAVTGRLDRLDESNANLSTKLDQEGNRPDEARCSDGRECQADLEIRLVGDPAGRKRGCCSHLHEGVASPELELFLEPASKMNFARLS